MLNGVRQQEKKFRPIACAERIETVSVSLRDSMHVVSDPKNLDVSVYEVFGTMLGVDCERREGEDSGIEVRPAHSVTAVVGFGGILSGACILSCNESAARLMAEKMTGSAFGAVDNVVKDGIGELCNMVAGGWKSKVPVLAANCGLSLPAVITGRDYNLHVQAPEFRLRHLYRFERVMFEVLIVCDGLL